MTNLVKGQGIFGDTADDSAELTALPKACRMHLGRNFLFGEVYGDLYFMKIDIFQLKWGGLMEAGRGGWLVPVTLGLVEMIAHGLFTPSVLRCWGECCEGSGHHEQGNHLGWLNMATA